MNTRKQLETCKHRHCNLVAEWNGYEWRAACLVCRDCHSVCGMKKKDRAAANADLHARQLPAPTSFDPCRSTLMTIEGLP